jgi:hypothetical protein
VSSFRGISKPAGFNALMAYCQKHPKQGKKVVAAFAALGCKEFECERNQLITYAAAKTVTIPGDQLKAMPHMHALELFTSFLYKQEIKQTVKESRAKMMGKMRNPESLIAPENPFAQGSEEESSDEEEDAVPAARGGGISKPPN